MKIIIAEDEKKIAEKLIGILHKIRGDMEVCGFYETVRDTVYYLQNNQPPDLVFLDIQLADGLSFEIFKHYDMLSPVVFITAFNQYAIRAFKVNSISYILKPFQQKDIEEALEKYSKLKQLHSLFYMREHINLMEQITSQFPKNYKNRFFVSISNKSFSIPISEISYFLHQGKSLVLNTQKNQNFVVNYSIDRLETLLDPKFFFRINRQYIIHYQSVNKIVSLEKGRLSVRLNNNLEGLVQISRSKTSLFKNWLDS